MSRNVIVSFQVCLAFLPLAGVPAASLSTGNGLKMELSPTGRVTSLLIGPTALPLKGQGGFALADFQDQPEPRNLVPNPGFEEGTQGWTLGQGQSLDAQIVHSGQASARLEVPGPAPASSNLETVVPVKPNTRYRVGMWLRREQVGVCGAYSSERDDQGQLTGRRSQVGPSIPQQDGTWLPLSWEITTEPKTTRLSLRADIYRSTGTLWLDDFFVYELSEGIYEPVEGWLEAGLQGLTFRGGFPQRGLELEATFREEKECLRVDGLVRDTTGRDRAVGVKFALPLDLTGWTWYTDAEERETIEAGRLYRYTYDCVSGLGRCSIYPWCALTPPSPPDMATRRQGDTGTEEEGGKITLSPGHPVTSSGVEGAGLSLALPLSQGPRVFLLQHDQGRMETALIFFFGLAKDAGNHPSRAPFSFVIYPHDPAWGMRSAMQVYYRLFPESFVKRPTYEGYLNYADLEAFNPTNHQLTFGPTKGVDDASDFGEGYQFVWHLHGCYDFRQVPYADPRLPPDEVVFSLLNRMVEEEKEKPRYYTPTAETIKKIVFGPEGQISYIGDTRYWRPHEGYNHTDQPGWGFNFRVNEDPDVSPFLAELARRKAEETAKDPARRPWDRTFTADAIEGYMANAHGINYRREHFQTTLVPLTFGYGHLKPAMPNTIWDFHHKAWWPLTQEYQILTYGNANGYEQVFTMPFVDIPMTEGDWDPRHPGRLDRYLRAIAHRKIWRYWHAWDEAGNYGDKDPAHVRRHFARGLAYAIFPAVYCIPDLEPFRALYRQYVPAIEELSAAGWDPVPHARATGGVVVERYGTFAQGELHFTLRNYSDQPLETVLTLDRQALGIPEDADLFFLDLLPRTPLFPPLLRGGEGGPGRDAWKVPIEADGTRALWVGTREQAARHGFHLAAATLEKLERLFATEMNDASRDTWARALKIAQDASPQEGVAPADLLALSEQVQGLTARLEGELATKSPVDLAKLLYRVRAEVSLAPVALLGLESQAERVVTDGLRGGITTVPWTVGLGVRHESAVFPDATPPLPPLAKGGNGGASHLQARIVSPWDEVAEKCQVSPATESLSKGQEIRLQADLYVPADPPRLLMPYLLELRGQAHGTPFTVAVPVDVQVGTPLAVEVLPRRAFRGQERRYNVTVKNRLAEGAKVTFQFDPPPKVQVSPEAVPLELPGQGTAEQFVHLTLEQGVAIGDLQLPYRVTSDDARFNTQGSVELTVGDPVPQASIKRVETPPVIDGRLTESVWSAAPLIPELRLLANGGPATEKTTVWAAYDDQGLYVALQCRESQMAQVVAQYVERGSPLYLDDDVELFIQPPGSPRVYQFAINSLGTQSDNFGNKADWKAAAQRAEQEWTVEVFIPYGALGVAGPPAPGLSWGMQFGRQQKPKRETTSWTPGPAFISQEGFGEIVFE